MKRGHLFSVGALFLSLFGCDGSLIPSIPTIPAGRYRGEVMQTVTMDEQSSESLETVEIVFDALGQPLDPSGRPLRAGEYVRNAQGAITYDFSPTVTSVASTGDAVQVQYNTSTNLGSGGAVETFTMQPDGTLLYEMSSNFGYVNEDFTSYTGLSTHRRGILRRVE